MRFITKSLHYYVFPPQQMVYYTVMSIVIRQITILLTWKDVKVLESPKQVQEARPSYDLLALQPDTLA